MNLPKAKAIIATMLALTAGAASGIERKGLTITPPAGWTVKENFGGSTLVFWRPVISSLREKGSIEVKTFRDGVYIDSFTEQDFSNKLVAKFSKASRTIRNYRILSSEIITLENAQKAILYYADYEADGSNMMQIHLLISSTTNHYLITYTDRAEIFQDPNNLIFLDAYHSLTSASVQNSMGERYAVPTQAGIAILAIAGVLAAAFGLRFFLGSRRIQSLAEGFSDDGEINPSEPRSDLPWDLATQEGEAIADENDAPFDEQSTQESHERNKAS